jgi:hypothetical protein
MELAYMFLADAAEATPTGRFFVFGGGVDRVMSAQFPSILPTLAVVAKIRVQPEEISRESPFRLVGIDPAGEPLISELSGTFPLVDPKHPRDQSAYHLLVANFRGLPLSIPGRYEFVLYADGSRLGSVSLLADTVATPSGETVDKEKVGGSDA